MTYDELVVAINQFLQVDEATFNANIDNFIRFGENDVNRLVQQPDLSAAVTGNFVTGSPFLTLPSDFLAPYGFEVLVSGVWTYLDIKEQEFLRTAYPNSTDTGVPRFYNVYDAARIQVAPAPDQTYTYNLRYFMKPPSIVDSGTTWVGDNAPDLLLYAAILHALVFQQADEKLMAMYKARYDSALASFGIVEEGRVEKDTYRNPNRVVPT